MPIYEYYCKDCLTEHEIRSSEYKKEAEMPYVCIKCGSENTKRFPNFPAFWKFCEKGAYRQDEPNWNSDNPDWNFIKKVLSRKRKILEELKIQNDINIITLLKKELEEIDANL